ncbi:odorant receptor 49b-like [Wyeomyia smithii]|uniref:odorant receptor 49b-like n=1 Tax=Wyeomyia smithii TaxID=174621 RepID=UPI00246811F7|nr:odorant receptor 49b-like [Wyeomyia smithii]
MGSPLKQEVLVHCFQQLKLIGLWGQQPRPIYRYYVIVAFESVFMFFPKIALGSGKEGFDSFARNIAEIIFISEVVIAIGLFNMRAEAFEKLVFILEEVIHRFETKPYANDIRTAVRKMERFFRTYMLYFWTIVSIYLIMPLVSTTVTLLTKSESERGDFMMVMTMQFYWLDVRRNLTHYGICTVGIIFCTLASAYQSMLKVTVLSACIQYGSKLFEFTTQRIEHLGEFSKGHRRRQELREIVEVHQLALNYVNHLEKLVSLFLLNQLTCCILMICLMMYYISTTFGPDAVNICLMFAVMMGEMAFFCFNGNTLSNRALEVGHAMYAYDWYLEPVDMQKDILFIIARSQRPTGITAAKFYFVNRERFAIVIQTSYSCFLVLKNVFQVHMPN